ncbi:MAG: PQQ-binding-like beta-propeller repeat protein [Bryobacteraceae bacterium]
MSAQSIDPGRQTFETVCARCHGADAKGGEMGPSIVGRLPRYSDDQLVALIHNGLPSRGMPPNQVAEPSLGKLIAYLRLVQKDVASPAAERDVSMTNGNRLRGEVLGEGFDDLQLLTRDKRVHLLRRSQDGFREVTSDADWPTYNGETGGNRYTTLTQINKQSVSKLAPQWIFTVPHAGRLQMTPVVAGGLMYVTAANQCYALDAGTGRQVWHWEKAREKGLTTGGASNRGAAVAGDRLFLETDNAHVVALNRMTGDLLWESEIADWRKNYFSTSAPLPAGNLVVAGVGGGEHGANGVVVAFDQATGKEAWRFNTVPKAGEPGFESWQGREPAHGGAPTWFTGSYDAELDTVFWPAGNPSEEYNGDLRQGDNLYSDSMLALDRKTGKLKWHYQFTPHDLWDWDSTETSIVTDQLWQGIERKLLLHADRNGFFYVLDRTNGKLLLAQQFLKNLTWASGIGADGRPIKLPNQIPTAQGTKVCPSQDGATNWYSPSFDPSSGVFYFQTFEKCSIYKKSQGSEWEAGKTFLGGSQSIAPDPTPERILRALNIHTGRTIWELPQPGPAQSWGGTLATASGLVIFGSETGELVAADASNGRLLWKFPLNEEWRASPMTYSFDQKQYIAVAAGSNVLAFGLVE